jgi:signal transduction histidine kinase
VKFTPAGGRVAVRLTAERKNACVSVFNSGSRVDAKDEKRIWSIFAKISDVEDNRDKGTGLGLSIVRGIIRLHGGEYGCNNQEDGVEFWFRVPV